MTLSRTIQIPSRVMALQKKKNKNNKNPVVMPAPSVIFWFLIRNILINNNGTNAFLRR